MKFGRILRTLLIPFSLLLGGVFCLAAGAYLAVNGDATQALVTALVAVPMTVWGLYFFYEAQRLIRDNHDSHSFFHLGVHSGDEVDSRDRDKSGEYPFLTRAKVKKIDGVMVTIEIEIDTHLRLTSPANGNTMKPWVNTIPAQSLPGDVMDAIRAGMARDVFGGTGSDGVWIQSASTHEALPENRFQIRWKKWQIVR